MSEVDYPVMRDRPPRTISWGRSGVQVWLLEDALKGDTKQTFRKGTSALLFSVAALTGERIGVDLAPIDGKDAGNGND